MALPRAVLLPGVFVALAFVLSVRPPERVDAASAQLFSTTTVDWHTCYGAANVVVPDALTCTPGSSLNPDGSALYPLPTSTAITTYDVLSIAAGSRWTMPTIYTRGAVGAADWGWNAAAPVASVTLQADLFCDGVTDTIAGGPGTVPPDPGPTGLEGANQPWPNPSVWNPYPFTHLGATPTGNDAYLTQIKATPSTFSAISYDRADLNVAWLGGAIPLLITAMQSGDPLKLASVLETSPYQANLKVQQLILGGDPVPPSKGYLCLDTPERIVWQSNGFKTPATAGSYPRWATLESLPDPIDGTVSRLLEVQCIRVGVAPACDLSDAADGDLVPAAVEAASGTNPALADTDADGATDYDELFQFTNPNVADTDGDGSLDKQDDLAGFNCVSVNGVCTLANLGDTAADDNCPTIANPGQENSDSLPDFTNSPNTPDGAIYRGDATNPHQDHQGDACDQDMDNDGLSNLVEAGFQHPNVAPGAAGGPTTGTLWCLPLGASAPAGGSTIVSTGPLNPDSDSDGGLDGRECQFGSDPTSAGTNSCQPTCDITTRFPPASGNDADGDLLFPDAAEVFYRTSSISQPVPSLGELMDLEQPASYGTLVPDSKIGPADNDSDGDLLNDGVEVKWYGTSPANFDTDGDGCSDGREAADVNGDHVVNVVDQQAVAAHYGTGVLVPGKTLLSSTITAPGDTGTVLNDTTKLPTGYSNKQIKSVNGYTADVTAYTSTTINQASGIGASDVSVSVSSVASFPASGIVVIGSEAMSYGAIAGNTLTQLTRGVFGTTAASAANGAAVTLSALNHTAWANGAGALPTTGSAYTVQAHSPLGPPGAAYLVNGVRRDEVATYDVNKDGAVDVLDSQLVAKLAGAPNSGRCEAGLGAQTAQQIVRG